MIHILPVELLSDIFLLCSPNVLSLPPKPTECPWTLCLVSSEWRDIAYQTPMLWSSLILAATHHTHSATFRDNLERTTLYLSRTASAPLSLENQWGGWVRFTQLSVVLSDNFFRHLILPFSTRLCSLKFEADQGTIKALLSMCSDSMSQLEDICLCAWNKYTSTEPTEAEPWEDTQLSLQSASRLRAFSLKTYDPIPLRILGLPWSQIDTLNLSGVYADAADYRTTFEQCINLMHCQLHVVPAPNQSALQPLDAIELPSLLSLDLKFVQNTDHEVFLDCITTPNLQEFVVRSFQTWTPRAYHDLLKRSSPPLRKFCARLKFNSIAIRPLLVATPLLSELQFRYHELEESVLQDISSGGLVPRLETLTCHFGADTADLYMEMMENRQLASEKSKGVVSVIRTIFSTASGMEYTM